LIAELMEKDRMPRFRASLVFALLFGTAGSAFAGSVYVPLATNTEIGGTRYQTQVWVSNRGAVTRRFDALFLDAGQDGTQRQGLTPTGVQVGNNATFLLGGAAPNNKTGMLEITGPDPLVVAASLVGPSGVGVTIPVVSTENLVESGDTANLLGLQRSSSQISNLAVLNLGRAAATCSLRLFRANGQAIGNAVQVTLPPLSNRLFGDVLAPENNISSARATVNCNQQFYTYSATFHLQNGQASISGPAAGAETGLAAPGDGGGNTGGALCGAPRPGVRCFDQAGVFFTPTRSDPTHRIELPFPNKVEYKKATVSMDITLGPWFAKRPDGIHNFFWFAQGTNPDRIGYANVRGPGRNLVYVVHHIGYPKEVEGFRIQGNHAMQPGQKYNIFYSYDAQNRLVEFTVKNSSGATVVHGTNTQVGTRRLFTTSQKYLIDFGLHDEAADAPTIGWKYANLKIEMFE
jgi:hypothetical protein